MDTPVMKCVVAMFNPYDKYFGKDSAIPKDKQVDNFMKDNLSAWMENPSDEDAAKQVKEKMEVVKKEGMDKEKYTELMCFLVKLCSEKKLGLKQKPDTSDPPASS